MFRISFKLEEGSWEKKDLKIVIKMQNSEL